MNANKQPMRGAARAINECRCCGLDPIKSRSREKREWKKDQLEDAVVSYAHAAQTPLEGPNEQPTL